MTQHCKCGWTGYGLARHRRMCSERREVEVVDRGPWRWDARLLDAEVGEIRETMRRGGLNRRSVLGLKYGLPDEAVDWIAAMGDLSHADRMAMTILVAPHAAAEAKRMRMYAAAARIARLQYAKDQEHRLVLHETEKALFARAGRLEWEFA